MLGMIVSRASSSFRMLDSIGCSLKNFLTVAVTFKILSLLQYLHLQIDLWEGICIACYILFKDHIYACQWSDTGPPGPLLTLFDEIKVMKCTSFLLYSMK